LLIADVAVDFPMTVSAEALAFFNLVQDSLPPALLPHLRNRMLLCPRICVVPIERDRIIFTAALTGFRCHEVLIPLAPVFSCPFISSLYLF
jgi:hypothetical protein